MNADAKVTVVSPSSGLNDEVAYRIANKQVDYVDRKFEPSDLDGVDMVLTAVDDPEASSQVYKLCKEKRIPANIADVPPECDFYFGSVHRDGPLQIMVSTNGNGPKLANIVRRQIAANLPDNIGAAIQKVGALRRKLRKVAPGWEPSDDTSNKRNSGILEPTRKVKQEEVGFSAMSTELQRELEQQPAQAKERDVMDDLVEGLARLDSEADKA